MVVRGGLMNDGVEMVDQLVVSNHLFHVGNIQVDVTLKDTFNLRDPAEVTSLHCLKVAHQGGGKLLGVDVFTED